MSDGHPDIIASKLANAFVPDAEMSRGARRMFLFGSASSVDWLRQRMGGLWVGGRVTLTGEALWFSPNALNAAAHADDTAQGVALADVVEVTDRFGWLTRIVDVRTRDGATLMFRCFGAPAFAEKIRGAVAAAQAHAR